MTGQLEVLNTGEGDIKLSFTDDDPAALKKAVRMLKDMQKRGYAILVQLEDGTYQRAKTVDEVGLNYVIMDSKKATKLTRKKRPKARKVPISSANAVAVARTAGG